MAKVVKPLTDTEVKQAKPQEKDYLLFDGDGLEMIVRDSGKKTWRFRFYSPINRKRAVITIGDYPAITLKDARNRRALFLEKLAQGDDPRVSDIHSTKKDYSLTKLIYDFLDIYKLRPIKPKTVHRFTRNMELHIIPKLGKLSILKIKPQDVIPVLQDMQSKGTIHNARRTAEQLNEVMEYAQNMGIISANPLNKIKNMLAPEQTVNRASLKPNELNVLMDVIVSGKLNLQTRMVLEWQLLTMTRPLEAARARWDQIDFSHSTWTISGELMKMSRDHVVVLCKQALQVLEVMKFVSNGSEFVFPHRSDPKRHMNSQSGNDGLKKTDFKIE